MSVTDDLEEKLRCVHGAIGLSHYCCLWSTLNLAYYQCHINRLFKDLPSQIITTATTLQLSSDNFQYISLTLLWCARMFEGKYKHNMKRHKQMLVRNVHCLMLHSFLKWDKVWNIMTVWKNSTAHNLTIYGSSLVHFVLKMPVYDILPCITSSITTFTHSTHAIQYEYFMCSQDFTQDVHSK